MTPRAGARDDDCRPAAEDSEATDPAGDPGGRGVQGAGRRPAKTRVGHPSRRSAGDAIAGAGITGDSRRAMLFRPSPAGRTRSGPGDRARNTRSATSGVTLGLPGPGSRSRGGGAAYPRHRRPRLPERRCSARSGGAAARTGARLGTTCTDPFGRRRCRKRTRPAPFGTGRVAMRERTELGLRSPCRPFRPFRPCLPSRPCRRRPRPGPSSSPGSRR